jgi:hypothetical protein
MYLDQKPGMKYTNEVVIKLPIDKAAVLFEDTRNLHYWAPGLESYRHLSGEPGEEGSKAILVFNNGKRRVEMIETLVKKNLPSEYSGIYETKEAVVNSRNCFEKIDDRTTRYITQYELTFKGIYRILGYIIPTRMISYQSQQYLNSFKKFAELRERETLRLFED